jgi:parallel beta-helix repeat protein
MVTLASRRPTSGAGRFGSVLAPLICLFLSSSAIVAAEVNLCAKFPTGMITSDVTLGDPGAADPDFQGLEYLVDGCEIKVFNSSSPLPEDAAVLTIRPGVRIEFGAGGALQIGDGHNYYGDLVALGTSDERITFTSAAANPAPGDWRHIMLWRKITPASVIAHAIIEYCGETSTFNTRSCIYIVDNDIEVYDSIVRFSHLRGIRVDDGGASPQLRGNVITENGDGIFTYTNSTPAIDGNVFLGLGQKVWKAFLITRPPWRVGPELYSSGP